MSLVTQFEKTLREKFIGKADPNSGKSILFERVLLPILSYVSGVSEYQKVCDEKLLGLSAAEPEQLDKIFERINIKTNVHLNEKPVKNQYILVCNHPTGPLEGIFIQKMFGSLGLRGKLIGDDVMSGVEQMKDAYIGLSIRGDGKSRIAQLRAMKKEIKNGLNLALFPAASVSHFDINNLNVKDQEWDPGFLEMARSNNLDIIPAYIDANLSLTHYILKEIYEDISSLRLFKESLKFLSKNAGKSINIYIGDPIESGNLEPTHYNAGKIQNICENLKYQKYSKVVI